MAATSWLTRMLLSTLALVTLGCASMVGGPYGPPTDAVLQVRATAQLLDDWVARVTLLPLGIAARQQVIGLEQDPKVVGYLAALLSAIPPSDDVYGVYIAFEDRKWSEASAMPWVDRKSWPRARIVGYDYHEAKWEWYAGPRRTDKPYLTEPYYDDGGSNITMISATRPVRDESGRFIGVAGADLSLQDIGKHVRPMTGEMYVVSRAGRVIVHPDAQLMLRKGYAGEELKNLPGGGEIAARPSGSTRVSVDGVSRGLVWTTAPLTGWKVVLSLP